MYSILINDIQLYSIIINLKSIIIEFYQFLSISLIR